MKNFIQVGDVLTLLALQDCKSGDIVKVGAFVGVATYDAKSGEEVETGLVGVYEMPKVAGALTQGALVYLDTTGKKVTAADDGPLIGAVVAAAGATDATCRVRLNGVSTG